jgi:hypothetical protein
VRWVVDGKEEAGARRQAKEAQEQGGDAATDGPWLPLLGMIHFNSGQPIR